MAATRILYLSSTGLIAYRLLTTRLAARLAIEAEFPADQSGIKNFCNYARAHQRSRFRMVADLPDETWHTDTLPSLNPRDRRALIARKLAQALPSPYAAAQSLGATPGKTESLLIFGIHRPDTLTPWLDALASSGAALASLHTLAQAAPLLITDTPRCLLLAHTRAGLRHVFIEQGRLRFSRLTPLAHNEPADLELWLAEADKTRLYLVRERLLNAGEPLCVRVLSHTLAATNALPAHVALDCAALPCAVAAETLLCGLIAKRPPRTQLAPAAALRTHRARRNRTALYAASAACALGLGVATALTWHDTLTLRDEIARNAAAQKPIASPAQSALAGPRAKLATLEALSQKSPGPAPFLEALSRVLDQEKNIEIDTLSWALTTSGTGPLEQLTLTGHTAPELTDARSQIDTVSHFTQALEAQPGWQVKLTRLPIDIEPGKPLTSRDTEPARGGFALQVSR